MNLTEVGRVGDPVVLLIHGFPFHAGMWRAQLDAPPAGWRLIAPDLPGFGASPAGSAPATIDGFADELAHLVARLGLKSVVVCGLSMGGYIAFALLRQHPGLVRGLVLSDTKATADSAEARKARLELAERVRREAGAAPVIEAMLPKLLSPRTVRLQPQLRDAVAAMMSGTAPATLVAALAAMAARPDSSAMLRNISIPTEIIVGEDDEITPLGDAQIMARGVPGAHLTVIPDAGHLPPLESPQLFNSALQNFLARIG